MASERRLADSQAFEERNLPPERVKSPDPFLIAKVVPKKSPEVKFAKSGVVP
jgi:hypothetical protein